MLRPSTASRPAIAVVLTTTLCVALSFAACAGLTSAPDVTALDMGRVDDGSHDGTCGPGALAPLAQHAELDVEIDVEVGVELAPPDAETPDPLPAADATPLRAAPPAPITLPVLVTEQAAALLPAPFVAAFERSEPERLCRRVDCTERDALGALVAAHVGFAFTAGELSPLRVQAGLRQHRLGVELCGVAVPRTCELRSLRAGQVRDVFAGRIRDWGELGGRPGAIVPVVPGDPLLRARAAAVVLEQPEFDPVCVAGAHGAASRAMRLVAVTGDGVAVVPQGYKLLRVDQAPPTVTAFVRGHYPFGRSLQLVTSGAPAGDALSLLAFARSRPGRELLGRSVCLEP